MKKLVALLIALFTLFLVSCGEQVIDTTATPSTAATTSTTDATTTPTDVGTNESTAETASTTETAETEPTETTIGTTETTSTPFAVDAESFSEHIEYLASLPLIGDYSSTRDIEFKNFFKYPEQFTKEDYWYDDGYRRNLDGTLRHNFYYYNEQKHDGLDFYIIYIAGCQGDKLGERGASRYPVTDYYAYCYKYGDDKFDDGVYTLSFLRGTPETQCYGWHRYDVGEMYLLCLWDDDDLEEWKYEDSYTFPLYLKIEEADGEYWVYSNIHASLEGMNCAVEVTDEYEKLFYKPGKDDDIIAYMEANGIENWKHEYKCELFEFMKEMNLK